MPELPEVETVLRGLSPFMEGNVISKAEIRRPDLRWPFPEHMKKRLDDTRVLAMRRRSKYILCDLDSGETLLIHLGMSGRMTIALPEGQSKDTAKFHHTAEHLRKHDHVVFHMNSGATITFNDPRRFGAMDLISTTNVNSHKLLAKLGPEPLGNYLDAAHLQTRFLDKRTSIKAALLDQRNVAGLGNIYVCEALWRTKISPRRPAGRISLKRIESLVSNIREVLFEAIEAGGSSLKDHRQANGDLGYFQHNFAVYGQEGNGCKHVGCSGVIKRIIQSGRSSFYCASCQR